MTTDLLTAKTNSIILRLPANQKKSDNLPIPLPVMEEQLIVNTYGN
jgi:hypothetical protein